VHKIQGTLVGALFGAASLPPKEIQITEQDTSARTAGREYGLSTSADPAFQDTLSNVVSNDRQDFGA
jgi:hypothetical protein